MELNDEQRAVVETLDKNILLTAPAGTGKTNTLAARIARIVEESLAAPGEILCLTFTNKACKEMRERIDQVVGSRARDIVIRTFHGFCYDVIKAEAKRKTDLFADFIIFDEEDSKEVIRHVLENMGMQVNWEPGALQNIIRAAKLARINRDLFSRDVIEDFRKAVSCLYQEAGPKPAYLWPKGSKAEEGRTEELISQGTEAVLAYERALEEAHGLDYDDLMMRAYELFRDEETAARWRGAYRYINVDEMQDTSLAEYLIISRLFGGNRLLLCGDYFQTIYEWRGSRPGLVKRKFLEDYQPQEIVFYENYRATRLLLKASCAYLQAAFGKEVERIYPQEIRASSPQEGEQILLYGAREFADEARWIYGEIGKLKVDDYTRVCVLTRDNKYAQSLALALAGINEEAAQREDGAGQIIPFFLVDEFKFFRRQEVKDVLAFLKLAVNPLESASLERVLKRFGRGIGERTVAQLQGKEARSLGLKLTDFVDPVTHRTGDHYGLLLEALADDDVVVFDVESTGTDTTSDDIIQLAAIRLAHDGTILEKFMKYVRTGKKVGRSELVHHISDDYLREHGEEPSQVFREFEDFVGSSVLVGHNVNYDINILTSEMARLGMEPLEIRAYYDTLDIFRRFHPNLRNHKLEYLGEYCQVSHLSTHDAFDDICATGEILMYAVQEDILPTREARCRAAAKYLERFREMTEKIGKLRELAGRRRPCELMADIIEEFGIKEYYESHGESKRVGYLRQLYLFLKEEEERELSARDALQALLNRAALSHSELDAMLKKHPKVPIITVHQAKGMEFDYVFMAGLMEGIFPSYMSLKSGNITEERRLFYVAMTRARQRLYLSWSQFLDGWEKSRCRMVGQIPREYIKAI